MTPPHAWLMCSRVLQVIQSADIAEIRWLPPPEVDLGACDKLAAHSLGVGSEGASVHRIAASGCHFGV